MKSAFIFYSLLVSFLYVEPSISDNITKNQKANKVLGYNEGSSEDEKIAEATYKELEKTIIKELESSPGIQVAIRYKGKEYNKTYGYSDFETKSKATNTTLFRNGSGGKIFVAYTAFKLAQEGKLDLDKGVSHYLSGLEPEIGRLTMRNLLSHTAGLTDEVNLYGPQGKSQHIKKARNTGVDFILGEPNEVFSYSNRGYVIAGAVIESITGQEFNDVITDYVFNPMGMTESTYHWDLKDPNQIAYGHMGDNGSFSKNATMPHDATELAAGLAFTTAEELNRLIFWLSKQHDKPSEKVLQEKLLEVYADPYMTANPWSYGYGLFHSKSCGYDSFSHSGGLPGYNAAFQSFPEKEFSIVVLANGNAANQWNIVRDAVKLFFGEECSRTNEEEKEEFKDFTEKEIKELEGEYFQGFGVLWKVKNNAGQLALIDGDNSYQLKKEGERKIVAFDGGKPSRVYTIFKSKSGKVKYLQYSVRAYAKKNSF